MVLALIYLQFHSFKNRTVMRVKRLKQPKYLLGAIAGVLYFYFYFYRWMFVRHGDQSSATLAASPGNLALFESIGALILFIIVLLAWIIPHQRAALAFTEAEVAFLFPAPISRRGLIHFKLLRSQTAILFTTFLLALVTRRFGSHPWIRGAGWWLILSVLNLHFLGSSFARTMLLERGVSNWKRRAAILSLVLLISAGVIIWARRTLPEFKPIEIENVDAIRDYFQQVLVSGPVPYLLFPFRLAVRPFWAPSLPAFLSAVPGALLILIAHYWWVIRSNVAFEEASVENAKRIAERVAAIRSGNWQGRKTKQKVKRAPFLLRPVGPPAVALFWKNLISAGQVFTPRLWILLASVAIGACAIVRNSPGASTVLQIVGMVAAVLIPWSLLIGPQFLRQDMRQDLLLADVLKMFPMRGWQIALGEILAPAAILTGIHWFLLILSAGVFSQSGGEFGFGISQSTGLCASLGLAVVLPMLNLIVLQIPNAAVLVFPAWFQAGKEGPHGIEATGQRLIFVLGQLVVFIVALIPASAVGLGVFLVAIKLLLGTAGALLLAEVCAAVVLGIEAGLGFLLLGWLFERFDLSSELTP